MAAASVTVALVAAKTRIVAEKRLLYRRTPLGRTKKICQLSSCFVIFEIIFT